MTQQFDDRPPELPLAPDERVQAFHFVLLTFGLYILYAVCLTVAFTALRDGGFYSWYYGPQFVNDAFDPKSPQTEAQTRLQLWAGAIAFWPFWLIPTAVVCRLLPTEYRHDLGVSLGRLPWRENQRLGSVPRVLLANLLLGIGAWLLIAPPSFGVNWLVGWLYTRFVEVKPEEHPLTAAAQSGRLLPVEWALLAFGVLVSAPLWEEILFRGLLPAVFRKFRGNGGHAAMMLAFATALLLRRHQLSEAFPKGSTPLLLAAMPALFILSLLPIYAVVCWRSRTENGPVVFGTALLFAAVHSFAWPTPVAAVHPRLSASAGSPPGPAAFLCSIIVHTLFNAVSFGILYFS